MIPTEPYNDARADQLRKEKRITADERSEWYDATLKAAFEEISEKCQGVPAAALRKLAADTGYFTYPVISERYWEFVRLRRVVPTCTIRNGRVSAA